MKIQAFSLYSGTLVISVATPRPEEAPSIYFTAATIHEDYCAKVRAILREWKHVAPSCLGVPTAQRLQTYFPTLPANGTNYLYAVRELRPAGSPRDIDREWMLEIMRIRYAFTLALLPAALTADGIPDFTQYVLQYSDLVASYNASPSGTMAEWGAAHYAATGKGQGRHLPTFAGLAEGIERNFEYAVKKLFEANNTPSVMIPQITTPGDNAAISESASLISITCELGPASVRTGVEIPNPTP